jgi:hypothetical protein
MTDLPARTASRLQRPSWRDSRLVVGVLLVVLSAVLGSVLLARADDRVPMYAARVPLVAGQQLTADDVSRVEVKLAGAATAYLSAATALAADSYVLREVRPGELIPRSAVGPQSEVAVQPLALLVDATSAGVLDVGSVVDVYVNRPDPQGTAAVGSTAYAGPEKVLEGVTVLRVSADDRVLGSAAQTRSVQVLVPRDRVQQLVSDVDLRSRITLVPVPGSLLGPAP